MSHRWSKEEEEWLKCYYPDHGGEETRVAFNKRFGLDIGLRSIFYKAGCLVVDHPAESVAVLTSVIGAGVGLIKRADRKADLKKAEQLKDRYIYDRSIGGYWHTRRKLTSSDMLEIERQKKAGRGTGEILRDMRLL